MRFLLVASGIRNSKSFAWMVGACLFVAVAGFQSAETEPSVQALKDDGKTVPGFVNVRSRLETQAYMLELQKSAFSEKGATVVSRFNKAVNGLDSTTEMKARKMIEELDGMLSSRILMALVYYSYVKPDAKKRADVIKYHIVYNVLIVRDFVDHPNRGNARQKADAMNSVRRRPGDELDTSNMALAAIKLAEDEAPGLVSNVDEISGKLSSSAAVGYVPSRDFDFLADYSLSYLGFIHGNDVELVSENDRSFNRIKWVNERSIFNHCPGPEDGNMMPECPEDGLHFEEDYMRMPGGPEDSGGHPAFRDPVFRRIRDMVDQAEESVFIDIFLFGGTIGGTLARHVVETTIEKRKSNPDFRTLILHDYATNYNMKPEMMPIFHYIQEQILAGLDKGEDIGVILLQANIQRHPPGVPFGITELIPKTPGVFREIEKRNTYYESKIDHSKVLVVDGNTDRPQAYFGSKNWSDHSGAYYFDDAIWVKGPAAAIVQASYYRDVEAALTSDEQERSWFFFKEEGFSNELYLPKNEAWGLFVLAANPDAAPKRDEILEWFKIRKDYYPVISNQTVRFAQADVDGTIKNVRNILVDMIIHAEESIYMEQLFVYDRYINDAMMKRKLQKPEIDIRIIADHNGNFGLDGLPNTIFFKEMLNHGIEIRTRDTAGFPHTFKNGVVQSYHQENHRKVTLIDGKVLLGGSSNLNPDTLQGSFREFGAQIFDAAEIAGFEEQFFDAWNDDELSSPVRLDDKGVLTKDEHGHMKPFSLSLGGMKLSEEQSALINDLGAWIFRSKDSLEERN